MASHGGRRLLYAAKRAAGLQGQIAPGSSNRPVSCLTSVRCLSTTKKNDSEFHADQSSFADDLPRVRGIDILRDPKLNKVIIRVHVMIHCLFWYDIDLTFCLATGT